MRLVNRNFDKGAQGSVTLIPEEPEDMWHTYNLIAEGDQVRSTTIRKVQNESATGSSTSSRVRTTLTISVESIDFDTQACMLRLKGRNIEENQYVKMGAYHTLDLELNRKFEIRKAEWDTIALERIEMACDPTQSSDLAAIVMQEGLAYVCLITASMTLVRSKIEVSIPRKRKGHTQQHEKGLVKFYESVMQGILRHVNFDIVKCVLIASPGFVRDQFYEYMYQQAVKNDIKLLLDNKSKFILVRSSSGFKQSLKEVLQDPSVMVKISDTKAVREVKVLEQFYTILHCEPARAFYGKKHVLEAAKAMAIETLLISDNLFRCQDVQQRKEFVNLVESVREAGGEVKIFSSMHISGEQLANLTGIAAILRFPMPELDDSGDEDDDDDDSVNSE
ncbi:PREDICTED: protein pelota [Rhagoletis zephyria]|uniref:protein pelota n=1 Tax=Rhagoletis zephyria TaxID=28612 RepID=UPI00081137B8|nr:PREDICTED: protein pelota [Rhagoletis zephyria]XP_017483162.1 PREDICTED: protein pelota [Rhagoletis zephyria]XP_036343398.1 protein pelota-like [Rhagoletis pomonella]XP_036343399.1 protein pelota-like [Rhagoletis pomonella]XP_036343400.1 protein pelota-like [Rhagoletis pomonella]XP_036343401.1 protein pelota-like [Rhagoletis pomonella]XP_036343429.1 protein pelota-like [Rhagoletis pomonella]XP_036343430.1 protein pelota-like [Rhagoletis pomonella]XP_036343431.1 protein pelota-like [Rhago